MTKLVRNFAGFEFPQTIAMLPRGPLSKRLEEYKQTHGKRVCGPYFRTQPAENQQVMSFYLDSDFMPDMRWQWADEVDGVYIGHSGWFFDDFQDETIRGIVFRLPAGRGFLAGWSMGKSMASSLSYDVWEDEVDAARDADRMAERAAENERVAENERESTEN